VQEARIVGPFRNSVCNLINAANVRYTSIGEINASSAQKRNPNRIRSRMHREFASPIFAMSRFRVAQRAHAHRCIIRLSSGYSRKYATTFASID